MQRLAFSLSGGSSLQIFVALSIFSEFHLFQKRKFAALIVDPEAYERISGFCLQPRVLALTGMRVVTQDFGRKSKLKFWS